MRSHPTPQKPNPSPQTPHPHPTALTPHTKPHIPHPAPHTPHHTPHTPHPHETPATPSWGGGGAETGAGQRPARERGSIQQLARAPHAASGRDAAHLASLPASSRTATPMTPLWLVMRFSDSSISDMPPAVEHAVDRPLTNELCSFFFSFIKIHFGFSGVGHGSSRGVREASG